MKTVTMQIPDDVYEHASTAGRYRDDTPEAYLARLLAAAVRHELLDEQRLLDGPSTGEDVGGNLRVDDGHDPKARRRRGW